MWTRDKYGANGSGNSSGIYSQLSLFGENEAMRVLPKPIVVGPNECLNIDLGPFTLLVMKSAKMGAYTFTLSLGVSNHPYPVFPLNAEFFGRGGIPTTVSHVCSLMMMRVALPTTSPSTYPKT